MEQLLSKYKELNESFSKRLVFNLGRNAGFFSEYNNMILVMLYCLQNNIRFELYSKDANFGFKKGWTDYFLPFCEESKNPLHHFLNRRILLSNKIYRILFFLFKKTFHFDYLTVDVFNDAREYKNDARYDISELEVSGNLRLACQRLIELTWCYNSETKERIDSLKASLDLPSGYVGLHIRGGDKFIEAERQEIDIYINKATENSKLKKAFVLTDDYTVLEMLREKYPDWEFWTLCEKSERGYFHSEFRKQTKQDKANQIIRLFTSMDILSESEVFIGTFSSNPGMYLGMRMSCEKTFSVDIPDWRVW